MTYQKLFSTNGILSGSRFSRGIILMDAILALSLASMFIAAMAQTTIMLRSTFESSRARDELMDEFASSAASIAGMRPGERKSLEVVRPDNPVSTTTIEAIARWYGNDRVQTDIRLLSGKSAINLVVIEPYDYPRGGSPAGTSLCAVDFVGKRIVGSYGFSLNTPRKPDPIVKPVMLPTAPEIPLTDLEVRNGFAYISADSSRVEDGDIFIVDLGDSNSQEPFASADTGPGISSIALADDKMYAAATSRMAQLQIISIGKGMDVSFKAGYKLPLPNASSTPAIGSAVFFNDDVVYLGTEKWEGDEFSIIDVSNPFDPIKIGGIEIGSKVEAIYARDGTAYITASGERQLLVADVTDASNPVLVSSFSPSGWKRQEGKTVSSFEDSLVFGRTSGGFNIASDHELFGWSPMSGEWPENSVSTDIVTGVYGIVTDRYHTFVATRTLDKELMIFDRNFSTTTAVSVSLPVAPQALTCDNDNLYVLANLAPFIYMISFE